MMILNLGDKPNGMATLRVKHLDTGEIGIVVGYGKRIVNNKCLTTVKVKLVISTARKKATIKDLENKWFPCPEDYRTFYPNPLAKDLIVNPVKRFNLVRSA